uniref:Uncharacterized protein n=1 Tax=viral metagenome TaxID=1070528 RepID=A0A6C0IE60_9ZZZZ
MSSQEIGTWVRNWVHYDNLASNLNKQTTNARKMRDTYEQQIISGLKRSNMENAIIKVAGAQLSLSHEKSQHPLTLSRIEEITHKYFELRGGQDETEAYMKFLRKNRGTDDSIRLKKTNLLPPAQAPATLL